MSLTIEASELYSRLREALDCVARGDDVVITEASAPRARLVAIAPPTPRRAGLHPGAIVLADDFDAPLPDEFWTGRE